MDWIKIARSTHL